MKLFGKILVKDMKIERVFRFRFDSAANTPSVNVFIPFSSLPFSVFLDTERVERESQKRIVKTKPTRTARTSHHLSLKSKENPTDVSIFFMTVN